MFEIDQRADRGEKLVTSTSKLYGNGAVRTEWIDVDGTVVRRGSGCLEQSTVDSIRADLRTAKWTVTHHRIACRAYSPRFTEYVWAGRKLFTNRVCSHDILDDESRHLLDILEVELRIPDDLDGAKVQRPRNDRRDNCTGMLCK